MSITHRLLAKSCKFDIEPSPSIYLEGHLRDVDESAKVILTFTAEDQLRAFALPLELRANFEKLVRLSCLLHDLGKANNHFQEMLVQKRIAQGLRHEWVTVVIIKSNPALSEWLQTSFSLSHEDLCLVLWAISGHHPATHRPSPPLESVEGAGDSMILLTGHPDFREALTMCYRQILGPNAQMAPLPELKDRVVSLISDGVFDDLDRWGSEWHRQWRSMKRDRQKVALLAAMKSTLIAADIAGSALPRKIADAARRNQWLVDTLGARSTKEERARIVSDRLEGKLPRPFQENVAHSIGRVILVRAGCGSGKTVAAYHWAATQHPTKRLYFCYPTTGTATEGFRDYLLEDDHVRRGAMLSHGRADIDLEILEVGNDDDDPNQENDESESVIRFESLLVWSKTEISCTVDTVLGLLQNNRRGLYAWPTLPGSVFVFDEIHAFDEKLFGALIVFLKRFPGIPVLLMSATLQADRLAELQSIQLAHGRSLIEIDGSAELESIKRYTWIGMEDTSTAHQQVRQAIADGGKVLWVCNTVDRALNFADSLSDLNPVVYHSRFRYEDRVAQHKEVIDRFKKPGPSLAISTQVAEMSLDLSADLLVTDLAPVPSMIQRLGRLNRKATADSPAKPFLIIRPEREGNFFPLPYTEEQLETGMQWLESLPKGSISQQDLAETWKAFDLGDSIKPIDCTWLDGGYRTTVEPLREGGVGITVILERDVELVRRNPREMIRCLVPMNPPPGRRAWQQWQRLNGVPVAPNARITYDSKRGGRWQNQ